MGSGNGLPRRPERLERSAEAAATAAVGVRTAGTLTSTVRITVPAAMRAVRLQLDATDPVGNASTALTDDPAALSV